jgi:exonuclease SbcD
MFVSSIDLKSITFMFIIRRTYKMKILHTADWHLGKRLDNFSRLEEQREVMQEICEIADRESADIVVVAGDLFDTINPPVDAVELFYKTLKKLSNNGKRAVVAIAGNHDSPDRIESPEPLATECGIILSGYPNSEIPALKLDTGVEILRSEAGFIELSLPKTSENIRILLTPYANEARLKTYLGAEDSEQELRDILASKWEELAEKYCDDKGVNILLTHLFMIGRGEQQPEEPEDEKPILHVGGAQVVYADNVPENIQYTALGHLHRKQQMKNSRGLASYSGSPISYSFSEANQKKYVLLIDAQAGKEISLKECELTKGRKLLRFKANGIEEAVSWLSENTEALVELTIVSDTFLTSVDRKLLADTHSHIISIIPEIKNIDELVEDDKSNIDLTQPIDDLFKSYFKSKNAGQEPNERIMSLFKEILAEEK